MTHKKTKGTKCLAEHSTLSLPYVKHPTGRRAATPVRRRGRRRSLSGERLAELFHPKPARGQFLPVPSAFVRAREG